MIEAVPHQGKSKEPKHMLGTSVFHEIVGHTFHSLPEPIHEVLQLVVRHGMPHTNPQVAKILCSSGPTIKTGIIATDVAGTNKLDKPFLDCLE